ncbi:MAG: hypothetical protein LAT82_01480, partial [Nanoarchaeota archaeon]|nr:hypothetical protein [Nanoarchaeota archaeon]
YNGIRNFVLPPLQRTTQLFELNDLENNPVGLPMGLANQMYDGELSQIPECAEAYRAIYPE